jgi:hypothetical protein
LRTFLALIFQSGSYFIVSDANLNYIIRRVAKWCIYIPKILILGYTFEDVGIETFGIVYGYYVYFMTRFIFYSLLVDFVVIWYIVSHFGMLYVVKNLANLAIRYKVSKWNRIRFIRCFFIKSAPVVNCFRHYVADSGVRSDKNVDVKKLQKFASIVAQR